jgi:hypothetical protein
MLEMYARLPVGAGPLAVGVNPVSGLTYIGNYAGQSISILGQRANFQIFLPFIRKSS